MNIAAIMQAIVFIGYVAFIWIKFGILHSISQSWYTLSDPKIRFQNLFWGFSAGVGVPMWMFERYIGDGPSVIIFAFAGIFMAGLGIASTFRSSTLVKYLHYGCTFAAIGFTVWGIYEEYHDSWFWWFLGVLALGCGLIALFVKEHKLWWIELWIFVGLIGRLVLNNLV